MRLSLPAGLLAGAAAATFFASASASPRAQDGKPQGGDMAAMMEKAKVFTQPGARHKELERFLGKWTTEVRLFLGGNAAPPETGTAEFRWLMEGRWLQSDWSGSMMRMPIRGFLLLGYDNFKQSFVMSTVSSMDTAMNHCEGDMDPGGKALLLYGTIDEYLTGEHDKMCKYVWRFPSKDKMVFEVHDLPIGEQNTKVIEVTYTRS
jgi:hypothetical protein